MKPTEQYFHVTLFSVASEISFQVLLNRGAVCLR